MEDLIKYYTEIINKIHDLGYKDEVDYKNMKDTPKRCAKSLNEFLWSKEDVKEEISKNVEVDFPIEGDPGIVAIDGVSIGVCPHHLLPVIYQFYVGYLPKNSNNIIGMSKLIRIPQILAKRPILQEQYVKDVTSVLHEDENKTEFSGFDSAGSFCFVGAVHTCMFTRGVESFSLARESSITGEFHKSALRNEVYNLVNTFPAKSFPFNRM